MATPGVAEIRDAFYDLGFENLSRIVGYFSQIFSLTVMVNILALFAAIPASGKTREVCFRKAHYCCTWMFQCLLGKGFLQLILLLSVGALAVDIVFLSVVSTFGPISVLVWQACKMDNSISSSIIAVLRLVTDVNITTTRWQHLCHNEAEIHVAWLEVVIGVGISTFGQVVSLMNQSSNFTKIQLQPRLADPSKALSEAEEGTPDYGAAQHGLRSAKTSQL